MIDSGISDWHGKQFFELATKVNVEAMEKAGFVVEESVKKNFTTVGGDANALGSQRRSSVRKTKSGKRHFRSLPGEPPAVEEGNLQSSITHIVETKGLGVIGQVGPDIEYLAEHAEAGTDVNYGYFLEVGTRKMAPRPYLRPALRRTGSRIKAIFKKANS